MTAPQTPRWYCLNNMGMATLCADKADAEDVARTCDIDFPRQSPHRAVQLVEVSGCRLGRDEIVSMAREAGFAHSWSEAAGEALERFATQATAKERTARIEAQVENEALKSHPAGKTLSNDYVALKASQAGIEAVTPEITLFAELLTRSERAARIEAQAMAECLDMLRTDLIASGVVGPEVAPMFLTEAVLSAVSRERTARIEAQQRLADMQELAARSGLAHRKAVQVAVSEAVAAEREACAALCESWNTAMTDNLAEAIRARGAQPTTPPPIPPSPANP